MHQPPIPHVAQTDPEIAELIDAEERRQREKIRLIPSENYVSAAVLEATGTVLTNKYSEGYPGKRYYEGQQFIDQIETLAHRARQGAVRRRPRQRPAVLGLAGQPRRLPRVPASRATPSWAWRCPMGGHLTHGWSVSITGKWFRSVQYGVAQGHRPRRPRRGARLARQERPKLIFCGGTAIPRTIDFAAFAEIAREVGAMLVADIAHIAGLDRRRRAPVAGAATPTSSRPRRTRRCAARAAA